MLRIWRHSGGRSSGSPNTWCFGEAPRLIRQLQKSPTLQRGIKIGIDAIIGAVAEPPAEITTGRPVTRNSAPTAHRARKLVYAPNLDVAPTRAMVVWTWVTYEEDPPAARTARCWWSAATTPHCSA